MIKNFYRILFDQGQSTCFSDSPKGTRVYPVTPRHDVSFFTINALDASMDQNPTEEYHSADRPRRADHNVVCFRNILIEMDHGPIAEQLDKMKETRLPYSTCVFSGGKSLHFIISLRDPLASRMEYARLVKRVYSALELKLKIDMANKNPSRFSRCPAAFRADTRKHQDLVSVLSRVSNSSLESWLVANGVAEETPAGGFGQLLFFPRPTRLFDSTLRFLEAGAPQGEWNSNLFRAACNLFATGHSFEDATQKFQNITGKLDAKDIATIKSAFRRAAVDSRP